MRSTPTACLVLDLDNTLLQTKRIPLWVIDPVVQQILQGESGGGQPSTRSVDALRSALYQYPLDVVAKRFRLSNEQEARAFEAFAKINLPPDLNLELFPDAEAALADLTTLGGRIWRMLLTRGFQHLQWSKLRKLRLASFFDELKVDSIDDPTIPPQFQSILAALPTRIGCPADAVLVVDDDPAKLDVARALGMNTVLVVREESQGLEQGRHRIVTNLRSVTAELLRPN